ASAFWLISIGFKNSSSSTSPGWILGSVFFMMPFPANDNPQSQPRRHSRRPRQNTPAAGH
ncbi:MAG: hypothetical protein P8014_17545, partial [Acidihalobacter sp.]|uniref:hypothetical protein n=1 Tax=Acidihalobacter sp. TaxID=1872108 RepID=UPI00307E25F6